MDEMIATPPDVADGAQPRILTQNQPKPLVDAVATHLTGHHDTVRKLITVSSIGLVLTGAVLLSVGVAGDSNGWWGSRPFLTNVISTITGACFGLPIALIVLRQASERRGTEVAKQRDGAKAVALCERMDMSARRIERHWDDTDAASPGDDRTANDWGALIAEVAALLSALREGKAGTDLTTATRPLTERLRRRGLGTVHVAAREMRQDWIQLQALVGPLPYLRVWEDQWAGPRSVDTRTFGDLLETLGQGSSHAWCDFFARLSDVDLAATNVEDVYANARSALRFLHDTGTVLARIRGNKALSASWQSARSLHIESLAKQYDEDRRPERVGRAARREPEY